MHAAFYGAVREVTGSMHLICANDDRIMLDCGMFQGRRRESQVKNQSMPIDPRIVTNAVLSHAHIDHSGRLPVLTQRGFTGRIVCTRATADAAAYLLMDSAKIQESDADYLNYKTARNFLYELKTSRITGKLGSRSRRKVKEALKRGRHGLNQAAIEEVLARHNLNRVEPLYTMEAAKQSLSYFDGVPYRHRVSIGQDMTLTFYDAGHILGSAVAIIRVRENGREYGIGFTGDYGRFNKPILKDPTLVFDKEDQELDLLIMESTYGARDHEAVTGTRQRLRQAIVETHARGGSVIIPSFAFGRTQEIVYRLHELANEHALPSMPVYVDSPLATNLTKVFGEHPEVYDRQTHEAFLKNGENPFSFERMKFVSSVEESMALMRETQPNIVIASSGMCEAGRVLHHLRYKIHDPRNTILVVGYMAQNTLGRRILEKGLEYEESDRKGPAPLLKILGKQYPLQARVVNLGGFSAHADRTELMRLVKESNLKIKRVAVVHGEEDQSLAFAQRLKGEGIDAFVPHLGQAVTIK